MKPGEFYDASLCRRPHTLSNKIQPLPKLLDPDFKSQGTEEDQTGKAFSDKCVAMISLIKSYL